MIVIDGLKLYDRKDLAAMLNVSKETIANYHKRGKLRFVVVGRKKYSSEESLRDFLNGKVDVTPSTR